MNTPAIKQYIWLCIGSGAVGAVLAGYLISGMMESTSVAQPGFAPGFAPAQPGITQPGASQPGVLQPSETTQVAPPALLPLPATELPDQPRPAFKADFTTAAVTGEEFSAEERTNIAVYEKVNRSVANITTRSEPVMTFFGAEEGGEGAGSGFVIDRNGHILTNHHVVADARQIHVNLYDGNSYEATLVGQDPLNDTAVIRIDAPPEILQPVEFGDSSRLRVGQKVFAIGNPFGLERTMTVGIISSLNRSLPAQTGRTMKSIIQIDAALNRGNSGGPLLDSHGRLIGMNTAIASRIGENSGVGFAIPVNTLRRIAPELVEKGRVIRPFIGIAQVYQTDEGLVVAVLAPGGPAERAGLRSFRLVNQRVQRGPYVYQEQRIDRNWADTITHADGKPVATGDNLMTIVESKRPGDSLELTVVRDGKPATVAITLGSNE